MLLLQSRFYLSLLSLHWEIESFGSRRQMKSFLHVFIYTDLFGSHLHFCALGYLLTVTI